MIGKKNVKQGADFINAGMELLTKATDSISKGISLNVDEMAENNAVIADLTLRNTNLATDNAQAGKVVANFKKNILGEE
jgi:hypothetical protein